MKISTLASLAALFAAASVGCSSNSAPGEGAAGSGVSAGGAAGQGGRTAAGGSSAGGATETGGATGTGGAKGSGGATGTGGASGAGGIAGGSSGGGGTAGGAATGSGGAGAGGATRDSGARPIDGGRDGAADSGSGVGAGDGGNITVWIAGDSTVATGSAPCPIGWGGQFKPHFDSRVTVVNSAVAGRSVRNWLYSVANMADPATGECVINTDAGGQPIFQQRWTDMLNGMKSGDYLFVQFGINDGAPDCVDGRHVGIETFKMHYGMMAQAAKDRGAHPVFLTPVSAIRCTGTTAVGTRGAFVPATVDAGTQYNVPVIELHALSIALYTSLSFCPLPDGAADVSATTGGAVGAFFCDDHTHFETSGAMQIGTLVANAVRNQQLGLAAYLQ